MTELRKWGDKLHHYQKAGQPVLRKFYTKSRGASANIPYWEPKLNKLSIPAF